MGLRAYLAGTFTPILSLLQCCLGTLLESLPRATSPTPVTLGPFIPLYSLHSLYHDQKLGQRVAFSEGNPGFLAQEPRYCARTSPSARGSMEGGPLFAHLSPELMRQRGPTRVETSSRDKLSKSRSVWPDNTVNAPKSRHRTHECVLQ